MNGLTEFEKQLIYTAFYRHVNMAPRDIEHRVGVDETPSPAEISSQNLDSPVVPESSPALAFELTEEQKIGRQLVAIKRKKKEELTDPDYLLMRCCVNHIRKHADKPPKDEDKTETWRESLMVYGYDPRKAKDKAQDCHDSPAE